MWTYTDDLTILQNIIVRSKFLDGVLQFYELYPVEGYVLYNPSVTQYDEDEEGNLIQVPYYTWGGATVSANYDFTTNPRGYCAVLYDESMRVYSKKDEHETI